VGAVAHDHALPRDAARRRRGRVPGHAPHAPPDAGREQPGGRARLPRRRRRPRPRHRGGRVLGMLLASLLSSIIGIEVYLLARRRTRPAALLPRDRRARREVPLRSGLSLGTKLGFFRSVDAILREVLPSLLLNRVRTTEWVAYLRIAQRIFGAPLMFMAGHQPVRAPRLLRDRRHEGLRPAAPHVLEDRPVVGDVHLERPRPRDAVREPLVRATFPRATGCRCVQTCLVLLPGYLIVSFSDRERHVLPRLGHAEGRGDHLRPRFRRVRVAQILSPPQHIRPPARRGGLLVHAVGSRVIHFVYAAWWFRHRGPSRRSAAAPTVPTAAELELGSNRGRRPTHAHRRPAAASGPPDPRRRPPRCSTAARAMTARKVGAVLLTTATEASPGSHRARPDGARRRARQGSRAVTLARIGDDAATCSASAGRTRSRTCAASCSVGTYPPPARRARRPRSSASSRCATSCAARTSTRCRTTVEELEKLLPRRAGECRAASGEALAQQPCAQPVALARLTRSSSGAFLRDRLHVPRLHLHAELVAAPRCDGPARKPRCTPRRRFERCASALSVGIARAVRSRPSERLTRSLSRGFLLLEEHRAHLALELDDPRDERLQVLDELLSLRPSVIWFEIW
jgi:hypothetical protein